MKLSSTPASKTNISASPGESHVEPEGASTCKEPTIQTDLQARKNHVMYSTFHEFCACLPQCNLHLLITDFRWTCSTIFPFVPMMD